ncbi:leukocyte elastase inhibitor-like [Stigmatopora argus]
MESPKPEIEANINFFLALFEKLREPDETCNIFCSPFSISTVLSMLMLGAKGNTAAQMLQVLRFTEAKQPTEGTEKPVTTLSHLKKELQLQLEQTITSPDYLKQVESQIKKLIKDNLEEKIKLVLVNTIHFEGTWKNKFRERSTREKPFHINKNDTKNVMMMSQTDDFKLFDIPEVNCQILELPYEGDVLSMLIFLPNGIEDSTTGLEKLLRELTYDKIMDWTCSDQCCCKVEVELPRFSMEFSYDLMGPLISMGMADAFDRNKSDFSGISPEKDLALSKFIHKAFVEVNECETVVIAKTEVTTALMGTFSFTRSKKFIADHPFLFFIRYNPMNTILFAGQFTSP